MGAQRRRNYNFRQSSSERSAESSYGNFKKALAHHINKLVFKKYGKN
jgi:hypothetical protein